MANGLNGQPILDKPVVVTEADATLSGTPKLVPVKDDSGTEHYVKAYPTKA